MVVSLLPNFKAPQMEMYDGSKDPTEHLKIFRTCMTLNGLHKEIEC